MNINILEKVKVVNCHHKDSFTFPEEGWFVGASNANMGSDYYCYCYLYEPKWRSESPKDITWGGYHIKEKNGELKYWWTYNSCFSKITTDYLYYCADEETARELRDFLNKIPSKSLNHYKQDITNLEKKIEEMKKQVEELKDIDDIVLTIKQKGI